MDSPFIEEGYMLYNITLRTKGAEQRMKPRRQVVNYSCRLCPFFDVVVGLEPFSDLWDYAGNATHA